MPILNRKIKPFSATAYHNGKFILVTEQTLQSKSEGEIRLTGKI